jgi:hypothetical protein
MDDENGRFHEAWCEKIWSLLTAKKKLKILSSRLLNN